MRSRGSRSHSKSKSVENSDAKDEISEKNKKNNQPSEESPLKRIIESYQEYRPSIEA